MSFCGYQIEHDLYQPKWIMDLFSCLQELLMDMPRSYGEVVVDR